MPLSQADLPSFPTPASRSAGAHPDAFEPDDFDFSAYLGRRFGWSREQVARQMTDWLRNYEPEFLQDSSSGSSQTGMVAKRLRSAGHARGVGMLAGSFLEQTGTG